MEVAGADIGAEMVINGLKICFAFDAYFICHRSPRELKSQLPMKSLFIVPDLVCRKWPHKPH